MKLPHARLADHRRSGRRSGFTLAEAAITVAIVGLTLTYTAQALKSAQVTAGHTRYMKVARELALRTLGEISTGQWMNELETRRSGSYAENGWPDFVFELGVGDDPLPGREYEDENPYRDNGTVDTFRYNEQNRSSTEDEEEEEAQAAFEKVQIRVSFPELPGADKLPREVLFEAWIPWDQVYGAPPEEEVPAEEEAGAGAAPGGTGTGGAGGGSAGTGTSGGER